MSIQRQIGTLVVFALCCELLLVATLRGDSASCTAVAAESPASVELAGVQGSAVGGEDERPLDSVWLVSCRHLACPDCKAGQSPDLEYYERQPGGDWTLATEADFHAAGEMADSTQVFVHGNRIEWCEAFSRGTRVYRALTRHAAYGGPIRFVIWSWPSSEICGPRRDARIKASRTYAASYHLGVFLSRFPRDEPLGMIGFSYGGRIVCGALHLMAGGSLCGWTLPGAGRFIRNARVALLASASHNGWLIPGQLHGRCWECVDQMLNYYNPRDPVLHLYPKVERWSRPRALGYIGICERQLGQAAERLEQVNVSSVIGCSHDLGRYLSSCCVMDVVASRLLWLD